MKRGVKKLLGCPGLEIGSESIVEVTGQFNAHLNYMWVYACVARVCAHVFVLKKAFQNLP